MLVWLSEYLFHYFSFFRVFQYLSLRSILATLTALIISWLIGPWLIRRLSRDQIKQVIRTDGPQSHFSKAGTPTMGGTLILVAIFLSTILWADLFNPYVWLTLFAMLSFGFVGWLDDYLKLTRKNHYGLKARYKYPLQSLFGIIIAIALYFILSPQEYLATDLVIPFFKSFTIHLGVFFIIFAYFVIVGTSNAVNLTDGLDGLAVMPTVMVAGALGIFAYVTGNAIFSKYLVIPFVPGSGEVAIVAASVVGAGLGFLWYNTYPAQVFMGDVGALGLGAILGTIAVIVKQELVLFIMGGIFVIETVSVILQVASFKLTGKRIFRMAPIHHHFELKGWPEPRVIVRFWIITFILVLIGLATLKLR